AASSVVDGSLSPSHPETVTVSINKSEYENFLALRSSQPSASIRWLRTKTNGSISNGSFCSNTLSESYQHLSNLFLSNGSFRSNTLSESY
ncbi:ycf2-A Protein, partial [Nymphaea thermarum]